MEEGIDSYKKLTVLSLTWPIFIETFLRVMLGNVDTFMLSTYSDDAVAAVGITNQITHILIMLYWVISTGTTVLISQYLGAQKNKTASEVAVTALTGSLIYGLVIGIGVFIFSRQILMLINVPPELMGYALIFLKIVGGFSFTQALLATLSAIIRSYGYTRVTMYITIGMNLLNVLGNSMFLFGLFGVPKLGVAGVAIATVVSQTIGIVVMITVMFRSFNTSFSFRCLIPLPKETIKDILRIGLPSAGEGMAYHLSQLGITRIITMLGTVALTTRVYTLNLMLFIMVFAIAVGQGTQIVVGHLIGAGDNEKAHDTCLRSLKIAVPIAIVIAAVLSLFSKPLLGIFTNDQSVIELGSRLMVLTLVLEPGRVFNIVIINCLKAAGDVKFPVIMGVISMYGIGVTLSYILGIVLGLGLVGVWIAFACDEWFRGIIMLWRWKSRVWENMSFVKSQGLDQLVQAE
ncbi:MAG: MATE family efflux transporter [Bacillota bacterium]